MNNSKDKKIVIFTTLLIEKSPQALPLGAACIASSVKNIFLTKDICDVKLVSFCKEDSEFIENSLTEDTSAEYIAEKLLKLNPDVVGFSIFVWNRIILEKVAKILQSKSIKTICGGPEVTARPYSFVDFDKIISGEGESKVVSAVYELITGKKHRTSEEIQSQLISKQLTQSENVLGKKSTLEEGENLKSGTEDLCYLTSPYLDGTLDPGQYGGVLWELARGCPFKCSYCYESKGEKNVRQFPMERIEKELDFFAKKKVSQVFVLDPTYNANKKRALELIDKIAQKTPNTFYYFEARAEFIDKQLAKAFTKIPCALQIGLQSANENVLKLVNRPFNKTQFVKNINYLNEFGVVFGLDVIYGLPGESLKGFKESIDFAMTLYPNNLETFCLSVLPGTDLYDKAKDLKLTFDENPPYHIIQTEKISPKELKQAEKISKGCTIFYNNGRAVPWFNTMCKTLRIKPSAFFEKFFEYICSEEKFSKLISVENCKHKEIEKVQIQFIKKIFTEKNLSKLIPVIVDIVLLNGAISRKIDTGISEIVELNYPPEYIDSEYSLDLYFFEKSVKKRKNSFSTENI